MRLRAAKCQWKKKMAVWNTFKVSGKKNWQMAMNPALLLLTYSLHFYSLFVAFFSPTTMQSRRSINSALFFPVPTHSTLIFLFYFSVIFDSFYFVHSLSSVLFHYHFHSLFVTFCTSTTNVKTCISHSSALSSLIPN